MKAAPEKGRSCGTFPERREMVPECHRGRSLRAVAGICRAFPEVAGHCRKLRPSPSRERHGRSLRTIPTVAGRGRKPIVGKALLKIWFRAGSVSGTCLGRGTFFRSLRAVAGEGAGHSRKVRAVASVVGMCRLRATAARWKRKGTGKALPETWYLKGENGNVVPER